MDTPEKGGEPAHWIRRLQGRYIGPHKLQRLLTSESPVFPEPGSDPIADPVAVAAQINVEIGGNLYTAQHEFSAAHESGDGGTTQTTTTLLRDGQPVFASIRFVAYMTYADDSEDIETGTESASYLLVDDVVAERLVNDRRLTLLPEPS
jgi:hypothetical protein